MDELDSMVSTSFTRAFMACIKVIMAMAKNIPSNAHTMTMMVLLGETGFFEMAAGVMILWKDNLAARAISASIFLLLRKL